MEEEEEEDLRGRRNEESLLLFVVYEGTSIKKAQSMAEDRRQESR